VAGLCYTSTEANGDYTLGYNWNNDANVYDWNSGLNVPFGRWSLVVLTVSATNASLYIVNSTGVSTATHTYAHVVQNFDGVTLIGDDSNDGGNGGRDFNGSIDEVMVFNQTLSSNQVVHLYAAGSTAKVYATPPAITQQPTPALQYLFAGASQQISAGASGQFLNYQWASGPVGGGVYTNLVNGGNMAGATNTTLTLTNLAGSDTADYVFVATNTSGSVTSSVARLLVMSTNAGAFLAAAAALAPVAYYPLNETTSPAAGGAVAYDYANGRNGVYGIAVQNGYGGIAGPRLTPDGLPGFVNTNYAAEFAANLSNAQITLPAFNLDTNAVTIAAWLKPVAPQNNAAGIVFCRAGTTVAGLCYTSTQANGDYTLGYNWNNDQNVWSWSSGLNVPSGKWSLVVLAVAPASATLYIINTNGVTSATHTYAHVVQNFDGVTLIGEDSADGGSGGRDFNGSIAGVAIFNQTLSLTQAQHLFAAAYAPQAGFTVAPASGWVPLTAGFTDASLGAITGRLWNFGDGNTLNSPATTVSHTYSTSGTYPAKLVVTGPGGSGTNTTLVVVNQPATPQILSVNQAQTNLVIVGQGSPAATYGLLSYTDLLTLTNGLPVANGLFDPVLGTSTNQVPVIATNPPVFFRLKSPYP
jgi:PKD repeat protein